MSQVLLRARLKAISKAISVAEAGFEDRNHCSKKLLVARVLLLVARSYKYEIGQAGSWISIVEIGWNGCNENRREVVTIAASMLVVACGTPMNDVQYNVS